MATKQGPCVVQTHIPDPYVSFLLQCCSRLRLRRQHFSVVYGDGASTSGVSSENPESAVYKKFMLSSINKNAKSTIKHHKHHIRTPKPQK